jgi:hypothetical protein
MNKVCFGSAENTLPLKGYAMGESYNLNNIVVCYAKERNLMIVIMPSCGEMLLQMDVKEVWEHDEDSPDNLDTEEWKQWILSKEFEVDFLHDSMIRSIVKKNLIVEHNLGFEIERKTRQFMERLGE